MEEQLLQFIWHHRLFDSTSLYTTSGDNVEILEGGRPNADQGPDFLHARIRLGAHVWAGHVEIHIRSSAWYVHTHDRDPHYNNVILHVVWQEDQPATTADGFRPPCLELAGRVDSGLLDRYRRLMETAGWVPCADALPDIPELVRTGWLARLMAERLDVKSGRIYRILERTNTDWEQTFFILVARQLGAPANGDPMEELTCRLPLRLLRRHADRPDQVEALLFGTAGMLTPAFELPYPARLSREYAFLKRKYRIPQMEGAPWRFLRMRPAHFPTVRLAQLAALLIRQGGFMELLERMPAVAEWLDIFRVRPADPFWMDHYHFTATAGRSDKRVGLGTARALIINVVAPLMYMYGKHQGQPDLKAYAARLWQELPAERHAVTTGWSDCGWPARDAGESQALLHLKRMYCEPRRCLQCAIGLKVMT